MKKNLLEFSSGGIKGFSSNENNVLKWCLSRPQQAINMNRLQELAGVGNGETSYKPLRESQIQRSEYLVSKVVNILENEFLNQFGVTLGGEELFNLGSGQQFRGDITELLNIWQHGKVDPQFNFKPAHLLRRKEVSRHYSPSKASFIL